MAYNRRRPTGGYGVSVFATPTKDVFEEAVAERGFSYTVERQNVGEWNEGRAFKVNGVTVEFAFKGSRPNWSAMVNFVQRMKAE